jgi:hypothetical protein
MGVLGKYEKQIFSGAVAMATMGIGLGLFSIGLAIFGLAIKLFESGDILLGAMIITGLGLSTAGLGLVAEKIVAGSVALAAMGVGLGLFSIGLIMFGLAIKLIQAIFKDLTTAGIIAGTVILGLGLAMAALGLVAAPIILGAVALTMMGVALAVFSVGLMLFAASIKLLTYMFDNITEAGKIAGGIILGLGLSFAAVGLLSPLIILGSVAITTMGVSLVMFSLGLIVFAGATKILNMIFKNLEEVGSGMRSLIMGIGLGFAVAGVMFPLISLGSAAMLLMGVSLAVFSVELVLAADTRIKRAAC